MNPDYDDYEQYQKQQKYIDGLYLKDLEYFRSMRQPPPRVTAEHTLQALSYGVQALLANPQDEELLSMVETLANQITPPVNDSKEANDAKKLLMGVLCPDSYSTTEAWSKINGLLQHLTQK